MILREEFLLVTDRAHYICGEEIHYRIYPLPGGATPASSTTYVELIGPDGSTLQRVKTAMGKAGGSGHLAVPSDIPSGSYYLKSYTRAMRNCSDSVFAYTAVWLYNPYSDRSLPVDTAGLFAYPSWPVPENSTDEPASFLELGISGSRAGLRSDLELVLANLDTYPMDLCVSVCPRGMHAGQLHIPSSCLLPEPEHMRYLAEPGSLSLSGRVVSHPGERPVPFAGIYLTFLEEDRTLLCNYSDQEGRFFFSLPEYTGNREIFISASNTTGDSISLLIDSDFSTGSLILPSLPLPEEDEKHRSLARMAVNAGMEQQFREEAVKETGDSTKVSNYFYGRPDVVVRFEDYIKLPVLVEYFQEVIPQVSVRRQSRKYRFQVKGLHPDLNVYAPLVMIDGVAILDNEALLAVSPRLIDRIEIVTSPYVRGNLTFGGIISVITMEGNMGFIDLPASGLLISYQMLGDQWLQEQFTGREDPRLPDLRNTLYWNPSLVVEPGKVLRLPIRTGDTEGDYEVMVTGRDVDGRLFRKSLTFEVKR